MTIQNSGDGDAGEFTLLVVWSNGNRSVVGEDDPIDVPNGLAAGKSIEIKAPVTIDQADQYEFTAVADYAQDVAESSEDDNKANLNAAAKLLPNMAFTDQGFVIAPYPDDPHKFKFSFSIGNTGLGDAFNTLTIGFRYTVGSTQGTLPAFETGSRYDSGEADLQTIDETLDQSGVYAVTALLDPADVEPESDESDNTAKASVTVP